MVDENVSVSSNKEPNRNLERLVPRVRNDPWTESLLPYVEKTSPNRVRTGALARLTSYNLATNVDDFAKMGKHSVIPKPITCLNHRIGDGNFLDAVQALERSGRIRICRFVNDKDLVCVVPTYKHVGFVVKMTRNKHSKIHVCYPKFNEIWGRWWGRAVAMSWPTALNLKYDHFAGEFGRRVVIHKMELEK